VNLGLAGGQFGLGLHTDARLLFTNLTFPRDEPSHYCHPRPQHSLVEGPETVTRPALGDERERNHTNYALATLAEATITILDDDEPVTPTVDGDGATPEISEDGWTRPAGIHAQRQHQRRFVSELCTAARLRAAWLYSSRCRAWCDSAGQSRPHRAHLTVIDDKHLGTPAHTVTPPSWPPPPTNRCSGGGTVTLLEMMISCP